MTEQQQAAMRQALEALELLTDTEQTFDALDYGDNAITALRQALEQQPAAWVSLTDEEYEAIAAETLFPVEYGRAIEAKLREKNRGKT